MAPPIKLKRLAAGEYQTLDGRFTIVKDPTSGSERGGWGYTSWCIFDAEGAGWDEAASIVSTLTEGRAAMAGFYAADRPDRLVGNRE